MVTDPHDSAPSPGHTSGPNKPPALERGNRNPPSAVLRQAAVVNQAFDSRFRPSVQQNNLLLQADTKPNLQQPAPSQPSKLNSSSATVGCRPGTAGRPAQAAWGQGTGGPACSVQPFPRLPAAGGPRSHWRQWRGTPSFPPRLTPGCVLLLRGNVGLFSGCPALAKPTVKMSVGNQHFCPGLQCGCSAELGPQAEPLLAWWLCCTGSAGKVGQNRVFCHKTTLRNVTNCKS